MHSPLALTRRGAVATLLGGFSAVQAKPRHRHLLIGTYTNDTGSKGIQRVRFDEADGRMEVVGVAAETASPSFLARHPNGRLLYAVNETSEFQGQPGGAVSVFALEPAEATLTALQQVPARGPAPCHLACHRSGRLLVVANYGGSYISYPVGPDGRLGETAAFVQPTGSSVHARQKSPHPHSADFSRDGRFAFVNDLGSDKTLVFRVDAKAGTITPHEPAFASAAPGAGPRHLAVAPDGRDVYVVNELNSTVTHLRWDGRAGTLTPGESVSTLPAGFAGPTTTAEIAVHPRGEWVYASNRGHDSLAIFRRDRTTGRLSPQGHASTEGQMPRHFAMDPKGRWLIVANQKSNSLVAFRLDDRTGELTLVGQPVSVGAPVCVLWL